MTPAALATSTAPPPVIAPVPLQQVIQVAVPERQRTNPVGVAALVLGILAALIAWVPFLGLLAIPLALLGALLGAIGLLYGLISRRGKVLTSAIGLGLSIGSAVLSVVMTGTTANRISDAMNEVERQANQSARPAIAAAPVVPEVQPKRPDLPPQPAAAPPVETWLSPELPGRLGAVQVRIASVTGQRDPPESNSLSWAGG
jgi:hypothetical protein